MAPNTKKPTEQPSLQGKNGNSKSGNTVSPESDRSRARHRHKKHQQVAEPPTFPDLLVLLKKIGFDYKNGRYLFNGEPVEDRGQEGETVLFHMIRNGIPKQIENLSEEQQEAIRMAVKMVHVPRKHLALALKKQNGFSDTILSDEAAKPLLSKIGYVENEDGSFSSKSADQTFAHIDFVRVAVRENGVPSRFRSLTETEKFSLLLWAAYSPEPLKDLIDKGSSPFVFEGKDAEATTHTVGENNNNKKKTNNKNEATRKETKECDDDGNDDDDVDDDDSVDGIFVAAEDLQHKQARIVRLRGVQDSLQAEYRKKKSAKRKLLEERNKAADKEIVALERRNAHMKAKVRKIECVDTGKEEILGQNS